jgi:hypothetical protein
VAIGAVVFDIGGVLEITPPTGWEQRWAHELGLPVDELERRIASLWRPGELGTASPARIEQLTAETLGLDARQLKRLTDDIWAEPAHLRPAGRRCARDDLPRRQAPIENASRRPR